MKTKKNMRLASRTIKVTSAAIVMGLSLMLTGCGSIEEPAGMSLSDNQTIDQVGNVDEPNMQIDGGADIAVTTTTPTTTTKPESTTTPTTTQAPATTEAPKPPTQQPTQPATTEAPTEPPAPPTEAPTEPPAPPTEASTEPPAPTAPAITVNDLRAAAQSELNNFSATIQQCENYVDISYAVRETDTQYGLFVVQRNPYDPGYFSAWMIKVEVDGSGNIVVGWYYSSNPSLDNPSWDEYSNYAGPSYWNVT